MTTPEVPTTTNTYRFELSGGGSGIAYRRYDYLSGLGTVDETLLGFVLVVSEDSPASYPEPFLAGREYSYFDQAVSDFSDVQILVRDESSRWPESSPIDPDGATWRWVVESSELRWVEDSAEGDFYVPDVSGADIPTGIGVDWASRRVDGRITWFGGQPGGFFGSLRIGDSAAFTRRRNTTVSGLTTSSVMPRG